MPPVQCPECGRFLKSSLVSGLADEPAPCPGCGTTLRDEMFGDEGAAAADRPEVDEGSVRPPDLSPQTVRDDTSDVLAGWDAGAGPDDVAAWRADDRPVPTDMAVVLGCGAAGLLVGWAAGRDRRWSTAMAGAVVGMVGAAVARRIWLLD